MKILIVLFLLIPAMAVAQHPELAVNLHTGAGPELGSEPGQGAVHLGIRYFAADDGIHGRELWRSDGTAAGTWMVKDIHPGAAGSNPSNITVVWPRICFTADDGTHGIELWCTSGNESSTRMIASIRPGRLGSNPQSFAVQGNPPQQTLFFSADDGEHGRELWRSEATPDGTWMVKDINPGPEGSDPGGLMVGNSAHGLVFHAHTPAHGRELWWSNGSEAGTVMVRDIWPGPASAIPSNAQIVYRSGSYHFPAHDGEHGVELWHSNLSESGTVLSIDLNPGSTGSNPQNLTVYRGNRLIWWANDGNGLRLWCRFANQTPVLLPTTANPLGFFYPMIEVPEHGDNGLMYFYGSGSFKYWRTDCTADGTYEADPSGPFDQLEGIRFNGDLYFRAYSDTHGTELHRLNAAGTIQRLTDINPGIADSRPGAFDVVGNQLLFAATRAGLERELWRYSGGTASLVANIAEDGGSSRPRIHGVLGDQLVLSGYRDDVGRELWASDGTTAGTVLLADAEPGPGSGIQTLDRYHHRAVEHQGHLYYMAYQSGISEELWRTDGSAAGTGLVINLCTEYSSCGGLSNWNTAPGFMHSAGPWLYFAGNATDSFSSIRLWRSNGTAPGTSAVEPQLRVAGGVHTARPIASIGDTVYVQASEHPFVNFRELWRVPPSGPATQVRDLFPGGQSEPDWLTPIGNTLYFAATDAGFGRELWKTDGTFAGTVRVRDIAPGASSSNPRHLTAHDGLLYFAADAGDGDVELWRSDGSAAGTYRVRDIHPGLQGAHPYGLFSADSGLYFTAYHPERGVELWVSDGTESGTRMLADLEPGPNGGLGAAHPSAGLDLYGYFFNESRNVPIVGTHSMGVASYARPLEFIETDDGRIVFRGCNRSKGCQLWISDGSRSGTYRLTDMGPAPGGASPGHLTWFDDRVYFAATDELGYRELWRLALPPADDVIFRDGFVQLP